MRCTRLLVLGTAALVLVWASTAAWPASLIYPTSDFSYEDNTGDGSPDQFAGGLTQTDAWLRVGTTGTGSVRAMLEFDLTGIDNPSPFGVYNLNIYRDFPTNGPISWTAYTGSEADDLAPTGPPTTYDEWNNETEFSGPDGSFTPVEDAWAAIDVTTEVNAAFDASETTIGFILQSSSAQMIFASVDATGAFEPYRPFMNTPEPASLAVVALGLGIGAVARRRRKR